MRKQSLRDAFPRCSSYNLSPVILVKKAKAMRKRTGDEKYHAAMELQNLSVVQRIERILARPFKILFAEPMLIAITLYMSVSITILNWPKSLTQGPSLSTAAFTCFSRLILWFSP